MTAEVRRDLAAYVSAAFFSFEQMRDQRDEALTRSDEMEDQRDVARRLAAGFEAEIAAVRELHGPQSWDWDVRKWVTGRFAKSGEGHTRCMTCPGAIWPCRTAQAVYLTDSAQ